MPAVRRRFPPLACGEMASQRRQFTVTRERQLSGNQFELPNDPIGPIGDGQPVLEYSGLTTHGRAASLTLTGATSGPDAAGVEAHHLKAWIRLAGPCASPTVMRVVQSSYIRYGVAAAHVHCAQPVGARNGQFYFLVRSL